MTVLSQQPDALAFTSLDIGKEGIVAGFRYEQLASRLMAMGVLPGSRLKLVRKAPFGGAWYVEVDHHFLALRANEAEAILIK